ncbi:hypothetical protein MRB53_010433 [Persea americana]|uniref:Uncharacterized protein n=1 Tax=Persea americana TaxID=3435 RepID=A0ACC2LRY2_PERAE|nr:hypothetical protein MRB53_010433 [Persea americana]|eukprot:TRINITY_DN2053_c0_g1_i1.p1 TRINITY_DN2053_c0_g1~~TRINITY_DN2053_c0_g1_i1.p1  ORF type:complete len:438 (-),score=105.18 TRINITY_DN2053_c0_g1_i1:364-1677(-)
MDSHRSFSPVSFINSSDSSSIVESKGPNSKLDDQNSFSSRVSFHSKEPMAGNEGFIGILEVHIYQARDIHNICIYHKQDVYAKLCLTSDPEVTVQTKTINGGGQNPVFNDTLRLDVRTIESSLKCEIWMLSRVRNYLEDQLLGFALVPLSDVVFGNEKSMQEFPLSSTDLFHSPAGFVRLSLSYTGSLPDVLAIPAPSLSASPVASFLHSESNACSLPGELDKMEFPDLKMVNENQLMVSEYFKIPHTDLESQSTDSLSTLKNNDSLSLGIGVGVGESFSSSDVDSAEVFESDTPPSSVSTNEYPSIPASSPSVSGPSGTSSNSPNQDNVSSEKEKLTDEGEADSSARAPNNDASVPSVLNMKIEPEKPVVQQEIVDLYMKSMQQFTESLAKMKLPMDLENGSPNEETGSSTTTSDQKLQAAKGNGSRVFYGSRAFF